MTVYQIACPHCNTPSFYDPPHTTVKVPWNLKLFYEVLAGQFNQVKCPICAHTFYIEVSVLFTDSNDRQLFVLRFPNSVLPDNVLPDLTEVPDYVAAKIMLLGFLSNQLATVCRLLISDVKPGETIVLKSSDFVVFKAWIEGHISNDQLPCNGHFKVNDAKALYASQLESVIIKAVEQFGKDILRMGSWLKGFLPTFCYTDGLLKKFADPCHFGNWDDLAIQWLYHYLCAIVHHAAGKPDPKKDEFTAIIGNLWRVKFYTDSVLDESMLLNRESRELISFTVFGNHMLNFINKDRDLTVRERYQKVAEAFSYYGWEQEFTRSMEMRRRISGHMSAEQQQKFADSLLQDIWPLIKYSTDSADDEYNADLLVNPVLTLIHSGSLEEADFLLKQFLQRANNEGLLITSLWLLVLTCKVYNAEQRPHQTLRLIAMIDDTYAQQLATAPDQLKFNYYIEKGTGKRYVHELYEALIAYEDAEGLLNRTQCYTDKKWDEAQRLLRRNKAIIYRDLGEYHIALPLMQDLYQEKQDDFGSANNLVTTYCRLNMGEPALKILQGFDHTQFIDPADEFSWLVSSAYTAIILEKHDEAQAYLAKVFGLSLPIGRQRHIQALVLALLVDEKVANPPAYPFELETETERELGEMTDEDRHYKELLCFLLIRQLKRSDLESAQKLKANFLPIDKVQTVAWELCYALLLYADAMGSTDDSVFYINQLVELFRSHIPQQDNKEFAGAWLKNKEEAQERMTSIACKLVSAGIMVAEDLLAVLEIGFALDLTTRLVKDEKVRDANQLLEELSGWFLDADFLIFFEADAVLQALHICFIDEQAALYVINLGIATVDLVRIRNITQRSLKMANPQAISRSDKGLTEFNGLMRMIGAKLAPVLNEEPSRTYLLGGKPLSNLPLHLISLPDDTALIERSPVYYVNSLGTLLAIKKPSLEGKKALLVSVQKEKEREGFEKLAQETLSVVHVMLGKMGYEPDVLLQFEATIPNVKQRLPDCDEVLFLAHGTGAGDPFGQGICLANRGFLPPALLMVEPGNDLKRFLLTWMDLNGLSTTPGLVVSTACSSGVTRIGSGGSQLALEQALFSGGTSAIISPMWDTEQESALLWISCFYVLRLNNPDCTLGQCYQRACLMIKEKFPHFFFWAPYIFKGID